MSSIRLPFFWLFFFVEKKITLSARLRVLSSFFLYRSSYVWPSGKRPKENKIRPKVTKSSPILRLHLFFVCFFSWKKNTLSARLRVLDTKISPTLRLHSLFFCWFFFAEKKSSVRSIACYLTVLNCSVPVFTIIKY